jgi:hypothetical protein
MKKVRDGVVAAFVRLCISRDGVQRTARPTKWNDLGLAGRARHSVRAASNVRGLLGDLKLSRCPHSFAATLAALPSISEIPFPRLAFGFAAVFFLVRRCFRDFAAAGCASDVEAAFFFRRASCCLRASLSRK